jgi:asparagine synthase (glutamine-hydrolysing)
MQDRQRLKDLTQQRLLYYQRITHFSEYYQQSLYTADFFERLNGKFGVDIMLDKYRQSDAAAFLDATLYVDFNLYLPDTLMTKTDIAGMTHSLEARMPILDHHFIEFVATIPPELKLKDGTISKYIFKKAVEPYLPQEVIYRPKMGFGVPTDHWFRNELKDMTYDILLSQRALERGYFQKTYVQSMLDRHQNGENWQYLIWNLLMLEMWHLMFIDKTLAPPALS